ncbi:MAG: transposase [Anaerolineae bacterium]
MIRPIFMSSLPQRKSPRLKGYDYSLSGAYFVTVCTHDRRCLFGEIDDHVLMLNAAGQIAAEHWLALPVHHPGIELDAFVVMPNHIHGIIVIVGTTPASSAPSHLAKPDEAGLVPTKTRLGTVIGSYKSAVTRAIRETTQIPDLRVWQARYYDHIIRNEADLNRIREYIDTNTARWVMDTYYSL